jgi:hypothetical protein
MRYRRRGVVVIVVAAVVGLAACESSSDWSGGQGYARGRGGPGLCREATSCASCTPIVGCGWCQLPDGTGRCVDDPNDCSDETVFSWTWDPSGCRVPIEAGAVTVGGGGSAVPDGSAPLVDAAIDAPDAH